MLNEPSTMKLMLQIVGRQTQTYFSYLLVVVNYYYCCYYYYYYYCCYYYYFYYYYSEIHRNVSKLLRTNERWLA